MTQNESSIDPEAETDPSGYGSPHSDVRKVKSHMRSKQGLRVFRGRYRFVYIYKNMLTLLF